MSRRTRRDRAGTSVVEFAIVCPLTLFFLLAIMVGGIGVMRYQQVASLAREGARWASVHGSDYARETKQPAATAMDIYQLAILPHAGTLDESRLSYEVHWNANNQPRTVAENYEQPVGNIVTVTVSYEWMPPILLIGPYTLTSSSSAEMLY